MYQYLAGTGLAGLVWLMIFLLRKDLRRAMVWGGTVYFVLLSIGFVVYRLFMHDAVRAINPGYWAPPTLFNLQHIMHGYGIEDALFMFFYGGIAVVIYEFFFRKKLPQLSQADLKKPDVKGFLLVAGIGTAGAVAVYFAAYLNDIYLLISSAFFAALVIIWKRRDLAAQSLLGGLLFVVLYGVVLGQIFLHLFPHFLANYYHLRATSGVLLLGIPLEEYLYAFSFGMFWAPVYSFVYGLKKATGY